MLHWVHDKRCGTESQVRWGLEASTGIEPVFTDLQSAGIYIYFNILGEERYHDKAKTKREPDTHIVNALHRGLRHRSSGRPVTLTRV